MDQRYQAVLAVIADGRGVGQVAAQFGASRQSVHTGLRRDGDHGLERLANRSHKSKSIPHRLSARVEAAVLELWREHRVAWHKLLLPMRCDALISRPAKPAAAW